MQKSIIVFLALLVVLLSAALLRLQNREQQLEDRLAAAERVRSPRMAPPPPPAPVVQVPAPAVAPAMSSKPPAPEEKITPAPAPKILNPVVSSTSETRLVVTTPGEPLPEGRRPGYLGITGMDVEGGGVLVTQVQPGTVAGLSGLLEGDVILEVNGEKVASYVDLATKMRLHGEGGPITLRIRRGATEFYQGAQLGPRPP